MVFYKYMGFKTCGNPYSKLGITYRRTVYDVHCTSYTVHCTLYTIRRTLFIVAYHKFDKVDNN